MRKKEKVRIAKNHFATTTTSTSSRCDITAAISPEHDNQMMLSAPSRAIKDNKKEDEKVLCTTTTTTAPVLPSLITFTSPATTISSSSGILSVSNFVSANSDPPEWLTTEYKCSRCKV